MDLHTWIIEVFFKSVEICRVPQKLSLKLESFADYGLTSFFKRLGSIQKNLFSSSFGAVRGTPNFWAYRRAHRQPRQCQRTLRRPSRNHGMNPTQPRASIPRS